MIGEDQGLHRPESGPLGIPQLLVRMEDLQIGTTCPSLWASRRIGIPLRVDRYSLLHIPGLLFSNLFFRLGGHSEPYAEY
jgi:hypothetical protein